MINIPKTARLISEKSGVVKPSCFPYGGKKATIRLYEGIEKVKHYKSSNITNHRDYYLGFDVDGVVWVRVFTSSNSDSAAIGTFRIECANIESL